MSAGLDGSFPRTGNGRCFALSSMFNPNIGIVDTLLVKMFNVDARQRPSIDQVIVHLERL